MSKASEILNKMGEKATDDIGKFTVVTKASKDSEMADIMFESDVMGMMRQAKGGLKDSDIVMITKDKSKAEKMVKKLLGSK